MKPNFFQKVSSLFSALIVWTRSGFKVANGSELKKREDICYSCEKWDNKSYIIMGGCSVCGCSKVKLYLKSSECPLKKW